MMRACILNPGKRFGQIFPSRYQVKGAYRFIDNEAIDPKQLSQALWNAGARACIGLKVVYAVHDTTDVSYSHRPHSLEGAGPIGKQAPWGYGFYLHSSLALRPDGLALGFLHHELWARDPNDKGKKYSRHQRPIEEKESFKWIRGALESQAAWQRISGLVANSIRFIHIMDREGDVFEVMDAIMHSGHGLIIRAAQDRCLGEENIRLWSYMTSRPIGGRTTVRVRLRPNRNTQKVSSKRKTRKTSSNPNVGAPSSEPKVRDATCGIRWSSIILKPPRPCRQKPAIHLYAVYIQEINPPAGVDPVEWMLLTTEPVETFEDAMQIIGAYRLRWRIEDFHLILKSGCRIEKVQFRTRDRIERMLPFLMATALRVLTLRHVAETNPDAPSTEVFSPTETQALITYVCHHFNTQVSQLSVSEALFWIARIGGFLGRKCDGHPGVRTLWQGCRDFQLIATMYQAMKDT
jgi:hypothetical protein